MTKKRVAQLYDFTAKLMPLLEEEIEMLEKDTGKSTIDIKRNVTETLGKLTGLIIQLNKLKKEEEPDDFEDIISEDQAIIDRFLEKSKSNERR